MSVAMPAQKSGPGSTVSIFGRKISWDALLVAAAGLAGVFFLYRVGQPSAAVPAGLQSSDVAAGGGGASGLSTTQAMPSSTVPGSTTSASFSSGYGASAPSIPGPPPSGPPQPTPTPPGQGQSSGPSLIQNLPTPNVQQAVSGFGSIPVIGSVLGQVAGSAPYAGSSPVNAVGTAAVPGRPGGGGKF